MTDRAVSMGAVVAYLLWGAAAAGIALGWVSDDWRWGQTGLALSAASATATIRCYFVQQNLCIKRAVGQPGVRGLREYR